MQKYIDLQNVSPFLTCAVCKGYLVDATTIVECLHSFCKSCILHHLETSYNCPKCNTEIHKTKPLEHIRSDPSLQEIVYKLVPNLFTDEERRREKWKTERENQASDPGPSNNTSTSDDDSRILVTFKYFRGTSRMERIKTEQVLQLFPTRYLCCQPEMPIKVLKKFVQHKFDISPDLFDIELWRGDETLLDELTLKQLVQIYGLWRERKPLELHFSLYPKFDTSSKKDVVHVTSSVSKNVDITPILTNNSVEETAVADEEINTSNTKNELETNKLLDVDESNEDSITSAAEKTDTKLHENTVEEEKPANILNTADDTSLQENKLIEESVSSMQIIDTVQNEETDSKNCEKSELNIKDTTTVDNTNVNDIQSGDDTPPYAMEIS